MDSYPQSSGAQPFRQPLMGSTGLPQNFGSPVPLQFRPVTQTQAHQFIPPPTQQFQPIGQGMSVSNVGMPQIPHFAQVTQQIMPRSGQPGQVPVLSQAFIMPYNQPNRPLSPGLPQPQQSISLLKADGIGIPLSSSYTFSTSFGQQLNNVHARSQHPPVSQPEVPNRPAIGHPWSASLTECVPPVTPLVQSAQPSSVAAVTVTATNAQPSLIQQSSDWQEHTSSDGKRYYYNKMTKQSSWEKPLELMTLIERADASTSWKEYTTPEGRKYYYNKLTKQSKWTIPDEVKLARELAEKGGIQPAHSEIGETSVPAAITAPSVEIPSFLASTSNSAPLVASVAESSPPVKPAYSVNRVVAVASEPASIAEPPPLEVTSLSGTMDAVTTLNVSSRITQFPSSSPGGSVDAEIMEATTTTTTKINHDNISISSVGNVADGVSVQDLDEVKQGKFVGESSVTSLEEKSINEELLSYSNKQEAKTAFKMLLESANVESDWTWEQAMRVIINDKKYGALRTLGERKQAFNEYLAERKKQEAEERRIKQKKAREEFTKMLEESCELSSSTRWSKALTMFERDERFNAIERARDREDLFEAYLAEFQKKEKAKAAEEHKRNIMEYREFLESCEFVKANSQWRKVQDRLQEDERCARLDKFDRLKIFQDYVHDLEKEEEEQRKIQKEQLRRGERKNREEFRKLMEEHVVAGILTAKTHWRDYYMEVKDSPSYVAVSSNTSGATPKDLFEDVAEELEKQYHDDKTRTKDALKIGKIALTLSSTFEDLRAAVSKDDDLQRISEINLKLVYDELLGKLRDKEEKEAKRRQRLVDNFSKLLYSTKDISTSSTWEDCKLLFQDCLELSSPRDESFMMKVFEQHVSHLQEKANEECKRDEEKAKKEKGRADKEKRKERKERERNLEKEKGKRQSRKVDIEGEDVDVTNNSHLEDRKKGKDKDRKHHRRHHCTTDEVNFEKDEKEKSRKSHRHSSDRKKSLKYANTTESESENRHKRQKKDRDRSHRNGSYEDMEDGELGEDGEIHRD